VITSIYQLKLCEMYANMQRLTVFGGSAKNFCHPTVNGLR